MIPIKQPPQNATGWYCPDCKSNVQSIERHFQRGLKTLIRTNYYCNCKPKRYYGEYGRYGWEEVKQ